MERFQFSSTFKKGQQTQNSLHSTNRNGAEKEMNLMITHTIVCKGHTELVSIYEVIHLWLDLAIYSAQLKYMKPSICVILLGTSTHKTLI